MRHYAARIWFYCTSIALIATAYSSKAWALGEEDHDENNYVFDPEVLNALGKQAANDVNHELQLLGSEHKQRLAMQTFHLTSVPTEQLEDLLTAYQSERVIERTHALLKAKYGDLIIPELKWVWNNVGGIYARSAILYCSLREYITMFGSPLYQAGFSGRYKYMDVYDIMISGRMASHSAETEKAFPRLYYAGDVSLLERKETRFYDMAPHSYMIDYGRGWITPSLWQGVIAPSLFVNHDAHAAWTQLRQCGGSVLAGIFHEFRH